MVARVSTVAFLGVEALPVDVQVQISSGIVAFTLVGLPDKAVAESRERVRAALTACGLALPAKRITINLAPADLPKEGSHYDLPIAVGLLAAMGLVPQDVLARYLILGELALDGSISSVSGTLPAAATSSARLAASWPLMSLRSGRFPCSSAIAGIGRARIWLPLM